jgi:hypothetical protein
MTFLVRWVHVASVSFLFGGALLLFLFAVFLRRRESRETSRRLLLDLMQVYEWGSWAALSLIVVTGIGNLGAYGDSLPDPRSDWGGKLSLKLVLVGVFLLFSAFRTVSLALARLSDAKALPGQAMSTLGGYYGATAVFAVAITGVAVTLAHFPSL